MFRQKPTTRLLMLIALVACGAVPLFSLTQPKSSGTDQTPIAMKSLEPPESLTGGMTRFLTYEDDTTTRLDKGQNGSVPPHGASVWGFYLSTIDQEPWRSQLIAQAAGERTGAKWPPLPLHGPILRNPDFQGRVLELYVALDVMPNQDWAKYRLMALQRSTSSVAQAQPCDYGEGCLVFTREPIENDVPVETEHIWRWRVGRIVATVSALGAPNLPASSVGSFIERYAYIIEATKGATDNPPTRPTPPSPSN